MTAIETFGKCKCGEFNELCSVVCTSCGARLPWAVTSRGAGAGIAPPSVGALSGVTTKTQMAQSGYWDNALTGHKVAGGVHVGYGNAPDIDFTPLAPASPLMRPNHYCSSCGMGLNASQEMCPRCRTMPNFNRADLRFAIMVGSLMTGGFLLGVLWCSLLVSYLQTGSWLPTHPAPKSTPTAVKKKPPADEYGIAKR